MRSTSHSPRTKRAMSIISSTLTRASFLYPRVGRRLKWMTSTLGSRGASVSLQASVEVRRPRAAQFPQLYPDRKSGRKCSAKQSATVSTLDVSGSTTVRQLNGTSSSSDDAVHDRHTTEVDRSPQHGGSASERANQFPPIALPRTRHGCKRGRGSLHSATVSPSVVRPRASRCTASKSRSRNSCASCCPPCTVPPTRRNSESTLSAKCDVSNNDDDVFRAAATLRIES